MHQAVPLRKTQGTRSEQCLSTWYVLFDVFPIRGVESPSYQSEDPQKH